jgi:NAD(P)-dependent dehydrogenase (short-subunit alcohol dehydrogenase family)
VVAYDLSGKVVLVTGATDGLGRALAAELGRSGATVLAHGRDAQRLAGTVEEIRSAAGTDRVRAYRADLASLAEVRRLAADIRENEDRLDVLVHNAGIGASVPGHGERMVSEDGFELRFAVNYLAGYVLTRELLPLLLASAPARIVNVSSAGQMPIEFDDPMLERDYSGVRAYCQSKLAQILFTFDLAEELADRGLTATAVHPATYMPTKIVSTPMSSIEEGVDATMRLIADPELDGVTGRYFHGTRDAEADPQAYDADARQRLRELSEELAAQSSRS